MSEYQVEVEHVLVTHEVVSAGTPQVSVQETPPIEVTVAESGSPGPAGPAGVTNLTQVSFTHGVVTGESIAANGFNTVRFSGNPSVNDGGGTWSDAADTWTVPIAGRYLLTARVRIDDSQAARSFGVGIHTSNADGPWFAWDQAGGVQRQTMVYSRIDTFAQGDQLRLYIYSGETTFPVIAASFTADRVGN